MEYKLPLKNIITSAVIMEFSIKPMDEVSVFGAVVRNECDFNYKVMAIGVLV